MDQQYSHRQPQHHQHQHQHQPMTAATATMTMGAGTVTHFPSSSMVLTATIAAAAPGTFSTNAGPTNAVMGTASTSTIAHNSHMMKSFANNFVARSDYEAARTAIQGYFLADHQTRRQQQQQQQDDEQRRQKHQSRIRQRQTMGSPEHEFPNTPTSEHRSNDVTMEEDRPPIDFYDDDDDDDDDDHGAEPVDPLVQAFINAAQASILANLSRVVQPIPDDEYQNLVDPYHIVQDYDDDDDDDDDDSRGCGGFSYEDDDMSQSSYGATHSLGYNDGDDYQFDEDELLDKRTWEEAKRLRQQVRNLSERVRTIRDRVLHRSQAQAHQNGQDLHIPSTPLESSSLQNENGTATPNSSNNINNGEAETMSHGDDDVLMDGDGDGRVSTIVQQKELELQAQNQKLKDSLHGLSRLLDDAKWAQLPKKLQTLQDTIGVLQKEHQQKDQPMSQTEAAIISRSNSSTAADNEGLYQEIQRFSQEEEEQQYQRRRMQEASEGKDGSCSSSDNNSDRGSQVDNTSMTAIDKLARFFQEVA